MIPTLVLQSTDVHVQVGGTCDLSIAKQGQTALLRSSANGRDGSLYTIELAFILSKNTPHSVIRDYGRRVPLDVPYGPDAECIFRC